MIEIGVRSKIVGENAVEAATPVAVHLLDETLTAAELIAEVVAEQIRDFMLVRKLEAAEAERLLNRQYLTEEDVDREAAAGAITVSANRLRRKLVIPNMDVDREIEKAFTAFRRGVVLLLVDGQQIDELDTVLHLHATSKVTFLRLTPLVGG